MSTSNDKVQLVDLEADLQITYTVEETPVVIDNGETILVDRVTVHYWYPVEDAEYPFTIKIEGWYTTATGKRDKRQKNRVPVFLGWTRSVAFVKDLDIDYAADFAHHWNIGN